MLTELKSGIAGKERQEADDQGYPKGQWRIFSVQSSIWPLLSAAGWEGMSPTPKELAVYTPGQLKVEFPSETDEES